MKKITIISFVFVFLFSFSFIASNSLALEDGEGTEENTEGETVELIVNEENINDITDEELTEAEPSELPEEASDVALTKRFFGRMLLDVEGNGEVYYVDPVTGGKEYLADGTSAHRLLERRALGINEENFAKLILGEEKDEVSVCEESALGETLKGRIVLRAEKNGEAYWIYPENCRAYYAGTHEVAYQLMRNFSLGMIKKNLAKIFDNDRQKAKNAFRYSVYAYAEDNDVDLAQAREDVKNEIKNMKECMNQAGFTGDGSKTIEEKRVQAAECAKDSTLPVIDKEKREELRETIKETRKEKIENKKDVIKMKLDDVIQKAKDIIQKRKDS